MTPTLSTNLLKAALPSGVRLNTPASSSTRENTLPTASLTICSTFPEVISLTNFKLSAHFW